MDKCFADKGKYCSALNTMECENCVFFKTKDQIDKGLQTTLKRISSLDKATRTHIYDKYFVGRGI